LAIADEEDNTKCHHIETYAGGRYPYEGMHMQQHTQSHINHVFSLPQFCQKLIIFFLEWTRSICYSCPICQQLNFLFSTEQDQFANVSALQFFIRFPEGI
jgi:hypothetical protein